LNLSQDVTLLTNGKSQLSEEANNFLKAVNVPVVIDAIDSVEHQKGQVDKIVFQNEQPLVLDAIFTKLPFEHHSQIPYNLGCAFTDTNYIVADDFGKTSVDGVYAAGDCVIPLRSVSAAVASGTKAGAGINKKLVEERFSLVRSV